MTMTTGYRDFNELRIAADGTVICDGVAVATLAKREDVPVNQRPALDRFVNWVETFGQRIARGSGS